MEAATSANTPKPRSVFWKKLTVCVVVILLAALAGAYFYFKGRRYVFTFTEEQIRAKLEERLPFTRVYLLIFHVRLANPRVDLEEGSDRVRAGFDVTLNVRIANQARDLGGSVDASGSLRYAPETSEFFLSEPIVHRLRIDGLPDKYTDKARLAVSKALEEYYAEHPVYSLKNKAGGKYVAARLLLKSVVTRDETLIVTLGL